MSVLELQGVVTRHIGPIDLVIEAGVCVCLSGPSGSGKSLLLRAIADLDPHAGETMLDGVAMTDMPAPVWRRHVGLLPTESAWWAERVGEHFDTTKDIDGAMLDTLGLGAEVMDWEVARLSTGERQRIAIARLLHRAPEVLLLDEPTASLDPERIARVEYLIADYRAQHQAAVLWVSHDPAQIVRVSSRHIALSPLGKMAAV